MSSKGLTHRLSWILLVMFIICVALGVGFWFYSAKHVKIPYSPGLVEASSLSSNGNYAITSHQGGALVLWNIKKRTYKIISKNANPKSAYFVKRSNLFMYQDAATNKVIVKSIRGKTIDSFPVHFKVGSQVITSNLKHYFASDNIPNVYYGNPGKKAVERIPDKASTFSSSCHFEMHLASNDKVMVSSGFCKNDKAFHTTEIDFKAKAHVEKEHQLDMKDLACVTYWDVQHGKPLQAYFRDTGVTVSAMSPDGKYIVSGDDNGYNFVRRLENRSHDYMLQQQRGEALGYISMLFVSRDNYLGVIEGDLYASLRSVKGNKKIKSLYFGDNPMPPVYSHRYRAFDSAPAVHMIITGQKDNGGIIVYRFSVLQKTLKRIWAPKV